MKDTKNETLEEWERYFAFCDLYNVPPSCGRIFRFFIVLNKPIVSPN